jgi:hypothetical protein
MLARRGDSFPLNHWCILENILATQAKCFRHTYIVRTSKCTGRNSPSGKPGVCVCVCVCKCVDMVVSGVCLDSMVYVWLPEDATLTWHTLIPKYCTATEGRKQIDIIAMERLTFQA